MSAEQDRPPSPGGRPQRTDLVDLGVNVGRMQRQDEPAIAAETSAYRVVIDVHADGDFTVYSDPDVQVIYRCAHALEDELVQVSHRPIPEEWLDRADRIQRRRIGRRPPCGGDRSVADMSTSRARRIDADGDAVTIHVPMTFRRRGGRKLVVTPDGAEWAPRPRVDNAMVKALARAFRWRKMLDEGVHATLEDLARAKGVAPTYVSRVLRLTLLAPEIVEAILDGRQPAELQLDDLREGFPLEWEGQHLMARHVGSKGCRL